MREQIGEDIVSFTPAPGWLWTAHFKYGDNEEWQLPIAGWALVRRDYGTEGVDNEIQPVLMEEGRYPRTLRQYCDDRSDGVTHQLRAREVGSPEPFNEDPSASLRLTSDGPGARDEIIDYVRSVIEQRTTPNDDTDAERLARGIVTSVLSRLGAGFSNAAGRTEGEMDR